MPPESPQLLKREAQQSVFLETLSRFGEARLRVTGTSMLPAIMPGDILLLRQVNAHELHSDDVILHRSEERLTIHRIVHIDGENLITRGDAMSSCDAMINKTGVLAKVISIERFGKRFAPAPFGSGGRLFALLAGTQIVAAAIVIALRWRRRLRELNS